VALPSHLMVHVASVTLTPYHLMARKAYPRPHIRRPRWREYVVVHEESATLATCYWPPISAARYAAHSAPPYWVVVHGASVTFAPYH